MTIDDLVELLVGTIDKCNEHILELVKGGEYTKRELLIVSAKVETYEEILAFINKH